METRLKYMLRRRTTIGLVMLIAGSLTCWSQDDSRQAALALEQQGKNTEAEAAWRALAGEQPTNPEPFAHLGLLEARQDRFTEAVRFYRGALALNPKMPSLQLNLGLALFKGGQFRQAIPVFKSLLASESPNSRESLRWGTGTSGTGTSRNSHRGAHPSRGDQTRSRSAGTVCFTSAL